MIQPMNINEAIEMMKIIGPHAVDISRAALNKNGAEAIRVLLEKTREESPINFLRMMALMTHEDIEKCAETLPKLSQQRLFFKIAELLNINPLADLVNGAYVLGLTERGWEDGKRTD